MKNFNKKIIWLLVFCLALTMSLSSNAQCISTSNKRILVNVNSPSSYNLFYENMNNFFTDNGYTIAVVTSFPTSITSQSQNYATGYAAFFMFGDYNYTPENATVLNTYLTNGGNVFMNYEIGCCEVASSSTVAYLNSLVTGLSASQVSGSQVAFVNSPGNPGFTATVGSCTISGNAYRHINGIPAANRLNATANLNGSTPSISGQATIGFKFEGTSLNAGAGLLAGWGDINIWYNGAEPDFPVSTDAFNALTTCLLCTACNAGTNAPTLSATTISNVCPSTTVNLTSITASNTPANTILTWHTGTPATTANKITGTAVAAGTYYAAFFDATNNCYSGTSGSATTAVTATVTSCVTCNAGTAAPSLTKN